MPLVSLFPLKTSEDQTFSDIQGLEKKTDGRKGLIAVDRKKFVKFKTFDWVDVCDAWGDLVAFVQFKRREKHPWRSVTFSKVAGL